MKPDEFEAGKPITRVQGKEYSPLIIRRYSVPALVFVALITDDDLDNLDVVVRGFFDTNPPPNSIQGMRNYAGQLTEMLGKTFKRSEGVGVIIQADKMTISSLYGDFMNHESCRIELYGLLNFATMV